MQAGPEVVAQLREQGLRVFLDLKFHDIPATMAGACRRAAALGAELITVHACAGSEALKAAQAAAQAAGRGPTLLAGQPGTRHWPGHRRTGAGGDGAHQLGGATPLQLGNCAIRPMGIAERVLVIGRPMARGSDGRI